MKGLISTLDKYTMNQNYLSESINLVAHQAPLAELIQPLLSQAVSQLLTPTELDNIASISAAYGQQTFAVQLSDVVIPEFIDIFKDLAEAKLLTYAQVNMNNNHIQKIKFEPMTASGKFTRSTQTVTIGTRALSNFFTQLVNTVSEETNYRTIDIFKKSKTTAPIVAVLSNARIKKLLKNAYGAGTYASAIATTLVHELVHSDQEAAAPLRAGHHSYLYKPRRSVQADKRAIYLSSSREIGAFAHNLAIKVIKQLEQVVDNNLAKNYQTEQVRELMRTTITSSVKALLEKYIPGNTAKERLVIKRYLKQIYQRVNEYIDQQA